MSIIKPPYTDTDTQEDRNRLRIAWIKGFLSGALTFAAVVLGAFLGSMVALLTV